MHSFRTLKPLHSARLLFVLVSACFLIPSFALGAMVVQPAPHSAAARAAATEELDEFVVQGKKLYQMRKDIIDAEKLFISAYNELNTDKDFDLSCSMYTPTGTHISSFVCKPAFFARAQEDEASNAIGGYFALDAQIVWLERQDEYRKHALAVINSHPELLRLIRNREKLEEIFYKSRQERMKGRLVLFE
jgi:hypothetical protein